MACIKLRPRAAESKGSCRYRREFDVICGDYIMRATRFTPVHAAAARGGNAYKYIYNNDDNNNNTCATTMGSMGIPGRGPRV